MRMRTKTRLKISKKSGFLEIMRLVFFARSAFGLADNGNVGHWWRLASGPK